MYQNTLRGSAVYMGSKIEEKSKTIVCLSHEKEMLELRLSTGSFAFKRKPTGLGIRGLECGVEPAPANVAALAESQATRTILPSERVLLLEDIHQVEAISRGTRERLDVADMLIASLPASLDWEKT